MTRAVFNNWLVWMLLLLIPCLLLCYVYSMYACMYMYIGFVPEIYLFVNRKFAIFLVD